jgi:hypothetical protein
MIEWSKIFHMSQMSYLTVLKKIQSFWNFSSIDLWLSHNQNPIRKQVLSFILLFNSQNPQTVSFLSALNIDHLHFYSHTNIRMLRFHICDYMISFTTSFTHCSKERGTNLKRIWENEDNATHINSICHVRFRRFPTQLL